MLNQALNSSGLKKRLKHFLTKASNGEIKQQFLDHSQGNIYSVLKRFIHLADKQICFVLFFKMQNLNVHSKQDHTIYYFKKYIFLLLIGI